MQETHYNCFGLKTCSRTLCQGKIGKHKWNLLLRNLVHCYYILALMFTFFFTWWRVMLCVFNLIQLLQVSWILWCYFSKCYSIILIFEFYTKIKNILYRILLFYLYWPLIYWNSHFIVSIMYQTIIWKLSLSRKQKKMLKLCAINQDISLTDVSMIQKSARNNNNNRLPACGTNFIFIISNFFALFKNSYFHIQ